jgi:hypothetical protein
MKEKIKAALEKLDVANDNHWTAEGLPRIEAMRIYTANPQLTREDVTDADPSFNRQNRAKPPAPPAAPPVPPVAAAPASPAELPLLAPQTAPMQQAPSVVKSDEEQLREEVAKLGEMRAYKVKFDEQFADQQARVDKLMTAIDAKLPPASKRNMMAVQDYLASQQAVREDRGGRWAKFKETGLKLTDILPLKAPIDAARARKR